MQTRRYLFATTFVTLWCGSIFWAADAEENEAFAAFDLGVSIVETGKISDDWVPLAESGLVLKPAERTVQSGQTIDSLLLAEGVRPDPHSRGLVALINIPIPDIDKVESGQTIAFFDVILPEDANLRFHDAKLVAVIADITERRRASELIDRIASQRQNLLQRREALVKEIGRKPVLDIEESTRRTMDGFDRLQPWNSPYGRGAAEAISRVIARYETKLASLSPELTAIQDDLGALGEAETKALTAFSSSGGGKEPKRRQRLGRLQLTLSAPAGKPTDLCELTWTLKGFEKVSHAHERVTVPHAKPIPVYLSDIVYWVVKGSTPVSSEGAATKGQLANSNPFATTVAATAECHQ